MNDERQATPYDAAIDDLRSKREAIDRAIQFLETLRDGTFMFSAGIASAVMGSFGPPTLLESTFHPNGSSTTQVISAGTFHGMNIETAVKALLRLRKRTMGAQEIVTDLRSGGLHLQSETPANTVTSVLTRAFNSGGDIVRVSRGLWGLQEWYPNQRFNRKAAED